MNKYLVFVSLAGIGSFTLFLFGGWDYLLMVLMALVVIDYITGVLAAFVQKRLASQIGFKGIAQKIFIFTLVATANFIDTLLWDQSLIRDATILFYIVNEIISIIENAGIVGLPVPEFLLKAIALLKDRIK
ncbi:phage holin family protein [Priestia abyssalis]|uniref:phage holin family protein n=1 Tax=Priestia abyssalis TaxID=1221450 RepID=UPI0011172033|nr:phage holin family protein [Priestia abyssalis]